MECFGDPPHRNTGGGICRKPCGFTSIENEMKKSLSTKSVSLKPHRFKAQRAAMAPGPLFARAGYRFCLGPSSPVSGSISSLSHLRVSWRVDEAGMSCWQSQSILSSLLTPAPPPWTQVLSFTTWPMGQQCSRRNLAADVCPGTICTNVKLNPLPCP